VQNKLQDEMRIMSSMLTETGFVNAAEWCEHMSEHLNSYVKHRRDFELDLKNFLEAFETDFLGRIEVGNRKLRQDCLNMVQLLLERAIKNDANIDQTLRELLGYVDRSANANKPIYKMGEVFNALDGNLLEVQLYGNLFTFMLHVDGQYFPTMKILCALKLSGDESKPSIEYVENLKLEEMKTLMGEFGSPLFKIYDNDGHHLRNAIAHCNFKYSDGRLDCWDINPKSKRIIWRKEFTIYELSSLINDLTSINHAFICWTVLRDLAEKMSKSIGRTKLGLDFGTIMGR
jgi:hypothetical protein